jgi:hypothetical protein
MRVTREYIDSLNDPFENEGPKLGWGCLVPTQRVRIYARTTAVANADGTLALLAIPSAKGVLRYANGGAAVATNGSSDSIDLSAISSNYGSGRVISIGIRAFPSIAATDAPGACYAGALEGMNTTLLQALTPNDLVSFPQSAMVIGDQGATAVGRPQDVNSFAFANEVVDGTGWAGTAEYPFSIPYLVFAGLPASTPVRYEIVVNIEALAITQHSSAGITTGTESGSTLASAWSSAEQMWNFAKKYLVPVGRAGVSAYRAIAASNKGAIGFDRVGNRLMIGY